MFNSNNVKFNKDKWKSCTSVQSTKFIITGWEKHSLQRHRLKKKTKKTSFYWLELSVNQSHNRPVSAIPRVSPISKSVVSMQTRARRTLCTFLLSSHTCSWGKVSYTWRVPLINWNLSVRTSHLDCEGTQNSAMWEIIKVKEIN